MSVRMAHVVSQPSTRAGVLISEFCWHCGQVHPRATHSWLEGRQSPDVHDKGIEKEVTFSGGRRWLSPKSLTSA